MMGIKFDVFIFSSPLKDKKEGVERKKEMDVAEKNRKKTEYSSKYLDIFVLQ